MTLLVVGVDETGMAAAADSWTYGPSGTVEHDRQTKVLTVFDRFVVGLAGGEYVVDLDRFDQNLRLSGQFAVDRWFPERPKSAYRRHHLAGESSLSEVIRRWESIQERQFVREVQAVPDVEAFAFGLSEVIGRRYQEERDPQLWPQGSPVHPYDYALLVILGFTPDGQGQAWRSVFSLSQDHVELSMDQYPIAPDTVPTGECGVWDAANETDWWAAEFKRFYGDQSGPEQVNRLAHACLHAVEFAIDHPPATERQPIGGKAHGAAVSRASATWTRAVRGLQASG